MYVNLIADLIGTNFPTILSVSALLILGAVYWWKVLPDLEASRKRCNELESENLELKENNASILDQVKGCQDKITELEADRESWPSHSQDEGLSELLEELTRIRESMSNHENDTEEKLTELLAALARAVKHINLHRNESRQTTESMNELMQAIQDLQGRVHRLHQRVHGLSSALYSNNIASDDQIGQLRSL